MTDDQDLEDTGEELPDTMATAGALAERVLVRALARIGLNILDDLCLLATHSGDDVFFAIIEELCDDLKPLLKFGARFGRWRD